MPNTNKSQNDPTNFTSPINMAIQNSKNNKNTIIGVSIIGVLIIIVLVLGVFFLLSNKSQNSTNTSTTSTTTTTVDPQIKLDENYIVQAGEAYNKISTLAKTDFQSLSNIKINTTNLTEINAQLNTAIVLFTDSSKQFKLEADQILASLPTASDKTKLLDQYLKDDLNITTESLNNIKNYLVTVTDITQIGKLAQAITAEKSTSPQAFRQKYLPQIDVLILKFSSQSNNAQIQKVNISTTILLNSLKNYVDEITKNGNTAKAKSLATDYQNKATEWQTVLTPITSTTFATDLAKPATDADKKFVDEYSKLLKELNISNAPKLLTQ